MHVYFSNSLKVINCTVSDSKNNLLRSKTLVCIWVLRTKKAEKKINKKAYSPVCTVSQIYEFWYLFDPSSGPRLVEILTQNLYLFYFFDIKLRWYKLSNT